MMATCQSLDSELRAAVRLLLHWTQAPALVDETAVAEACDAVKRWTDVRGHMRTAAYFAEAAAFAEPDNPFRANEAGRVCRRAGLDLRAAMWFFRGFGLAVRLRRHAEATQALLGQAALMYHLGEHQASRRFLRKATRRARRGGQRKQAAFAQHELVLEAAEARTYSAGERHVLEALWLYPQSHQRFPAFVHDFGYLLAEKRLYTHALPLLRAVLPLIPRPAEQSVVWANIARAAAGAGRIQLYRESCDTAEGLSCEFGEHAAATYSLLATAAWLTGERERARQFAAQAQRIAEERRERYPAARARFVLDGIASDQVPPTELAPPPENQIEALTRQCLSRLRKWKPRPNAGPGPFYP